MQREARRSVRYDVHLNCRVSSPFRAFEQVNGTTLNVSRMGMLVSVDSPAGAGFAPQTGHAARVVMELPADRSARRPCVTCLGRIVRLEGTDSCRRLAVEFRRFEFTELASE